MSAGVELDDSGVVDFEGYAQVVGRGQPKYPAGKVFVVDGEPIGCSEAYDGGIGGDALEEFAAASFYDYGIAGPDVIRGEVNFAAIYQEMAVGNHLAGLPDGACPVQAADDVVEPRFKDLL